MSLVFLGRGADNAALDVIIEPLAAPGRQRHRLRRWKHGSLPFLCQTLSSVPTEALREADRQRGRNQRADTDSDQGLWAGGVDCGSCSAGVFPWPGGQRPGKEVSRSLPSLTCTSFIGRITWAMHNRMQLSADPAGKRWLLFPPRPLLLPCPLPAPTHPTPPHGLRPMRAFRSYHHCLIRLPVLIATHSCFCSRHLRPTVRRTSQWGKAGEVWLQLATH